MRSHGSRLRRPRPSKVGVGPGVYGRFRGRDRQGVPKTDAAHTCGRGRTRSEEHTSELQSLMRISYAVFRLKTNTHRPDTNMTHMNTHHMPTTRMNAYYMKHTS